MKNSKYGIPNSPSMRRAALAVMVWAAGAVLVPFDARAVDAVANEGHPVEFTVKVPADWSNLGYTHSIRYSYRTEDDTARAGEDYEAVSGKLVFSNVNQSRRIQVTTYDDNTHWKKTETFVLKLHSPEISSPTWTGATWSPVQQGLPSELALIGTIVRW